MHISLIFHQVVWRRIYGVVEYIIITLLQIVRRVYQWKNLENWSVIGEDIDKSNVACFLAHFVHNTLHHISACLCVTLWFMYLRNEIVYIVRFDTLILCILLCYYIIPYHFVLWHLKHIQQYNHFSQYFDVQFVWCVILLLFASSDIMYIFVI